MVNGFEDVGFYEVSLAEDLYACTIAIEDVAMLDELCELDFRHFHQSVHLVLGSFEVLDAEGIDRDMCNAGFIAYFQYLQICQRPCRIFVNNVLTLARASKPKLCPSTVSILLFFANRLFPSMTKATCLGIGPCRRAPMSSSRSCVRAHSAGGEVRSQFRTRDTGRAAIVFTV